MRFAILLAMAMSGTAAAGPPQSNAPPAAPTTSEKPADDGLRQELLRRMQADQDARKAMLASTPKQGKDGPAAPEASLATVKRMGEVDRRNTLRMKEIVDRQGWPGKSLVGRDGAHAAWILVQHADHDRPFQKRCLDLLKEAVKKEEATPEDVAYLTDRVLVGEKKKQRYGTQLIEIDGRLQPQPIEDEANVDQRRKEIGLPPLAEYLQFSEAAMKEWRKGKP